MSDPAQAPAFGKKFVHGITDGYAGYKNERVAQDAIRDLMLFSNVLEAEMKKMVERAQKGGEMDHQLYSKMTLVKEKYAYAMSGLKAFDDTMERMAMMSLADAIQDLMMMMHSKRGH